MKIQWLGNDAFILSGKDTAVHFNPADGKAAGTFAVSSTPGDNTDQSGDKMFNLPGEFEVAGILAQGFYSDGGENIVHKIVMEETGIVYFGNLKETPKSDFFEDLGENTDIVMINLSKEFDNKAAKDLITKITPRMAILGGDATYFPPLMESLNAKTAETNPLTIKGLSDENTEVFILPL